MNTHVTCTVLANHTVNHTCEWESSTATTVAGNSTSMPKYKARYYLTANDPEPTPCPSQLHICHVCQSTETCTSTLICKEPHDATPASKNTTQHGHDKTYDQKIDWESYFLSLIMNMQEPKLGSTNYMTDVIVTAVMLYKFYSTLGKQPVYINGSTDTRWTQSHFCFYTHTVSRRPWRKLFRIWLTCCYNAANRSMTQTRGTSFRVALLDLP